MPDITFDVTAWLEAIQSAQSLDALQKVYNDATSAALLAKDKEAKIIIIAEKDKKKAEFV